MRFSKKKVKSEELELRISKKKVKSWELELAKMYLRVELGANLTFSHLWAPCPPCPKSCQNMTRTWRTAAIKESTERYC